jgi:hypothetical protein
MIILPRLANRNASNSQEESAEDISGNHDYKQQQNEHGNGDGLALDEQNWILNLDRRDGAVPVAAKQ